MGRAVRRGQVGLETAMTNPDGTPVARYSIRMTAWAWQRHGFAYDSEHTV
jgi:hypothetical protein